MKTYLEYLWPVIGFGAVALSGWLLFQEFQGNSFKDIVNTLTAIPPHRYGLALIATLTAYAMLAAYDRVALMHLGMAKDVSWMYIMLTSFTTYALSHNIGASVVSGGMVRYRAYSAKGLTAGQVAILVAFCSFTFAFGMLVLGGVVFTFEPSLIQRLLDIPTHAAYLIGVGSLTIVGLYLLGAWLEFKPLKIRSFYLEYPRLPVAVRQIVVAPLEIMSAAAIIYFALPEQGNPGYFVVLGVFVAVFSAALISQAPGGLGVMELLFLKALPDIPKLDVLGALIVFRLLYLLIPLAIAGGIVLIFEQRQLVKKL